MKGLSRNYKSEPGKVEILSLLHLILELEQAVRLRLDAGRAAEVLERVGGHARADLLAPRRAPGVLPAGDGATRTLHEAVVLEVVQDLIRLTKKG